MSLDQILNAGKAGKAKAAKKIRQRHGIVASDSKYTGELPCFDGCETWPVEKFMKERNRGINFYNYYQCAGDLKAGVLEWMTIHNYSKDDVKAVKDAPEYLPGTTVGSLCAMMNRGMVPLHPFAQEWHDSMPGIGGSAKSDADYVHDILKKTIKEGKTIKVEAEVAAIVANKEPSISPIERLRLKVNSTVILVLEDLLESWMDPLIEPKPIPLYEIMRGNQLPGMACGQIKTWLNKYLSEMRSALDKSDPDLVQGYSYLTTKQLSARVKVLDDMVMDLTKHQHTIKATKAPRVKKVQSSLKQVEKLKYCKQDNDLKLTSVNPVRLIGSFRVFAYNRKTKTLVYYVSTSTKGFGVKGTTLQNIDESKSFSRSLRKPEVVLPTILTSTPKQISKLWDSLTTKVNKPNGRINDDIILVRVFEQPTE